MNIKTVSFFKQTKDVGIVHIPVDFIYQLKWKIHDDVFINYDKDKAIISSREEFENIKDMEIAKTTITGSTIKNYTSHRLILGVKIITTLGLSRDENKVTIDLQDKKLILRKYARL